MNTKFNVSEVLGRHVLAEFYGVDFNLLDDVNFLKRITATAISQAKMNLRKLVFDKFEPQGVTMIAILSESHIAIHTWPEKGSCAVECFTCGNEGDPVKAIEIFEKNLNPLDKHIEEKIRGKIKAP